MASMQLRRPILISALSGVPFPLPFSVGFPPSRNDFRIRDQRSKKKAMKNGSPWPNEKAMGFPPMAFEFYRFSESP
jgi:hypothetical protein